MSEYLVDREVMASTSESLAKRYLRLSDKYKHIEEINQLRKLKATLDQDQNELKQRQIHEYREAQAKKNREMVASMKNQRSQEATRETSQNQGYQVDFVALKEAYSRALIEDYFDDKFEEEETDD